MKLFITWITFLTVVFLGVLGQADLDEHTPVDNVLACHQNSIFPRYIISFGTAADAEDVRKIESVLEELLAEGKITIFLTSELDEPKIVGFLPTRGAKEEVVERVRLMVEWIRGNPNIWMRCTVDKGGFTEAN